MLNAIPSRFASTQQPVRQGITLVVAIVLAAWFATVVLLGARGAFITAPGSPPLPILMGVMLPIIVFFAAFRLSGSFRAFALSVDLRLMVAIQAWRAGGLGFLALYANGILPGSFAWPAGLGDIAIGVTAPWVMLALIRHPGFAAGKLFVAWNGLGLLDLMLAVSLGALNSVIPAEMGGQGSTTAMAHLPLVLVPAYFVPLFVMLHAAALVQSRRMMP